MSSCMVLNEVVEMEDAERKSWIGLIAKAVDDRVSELFDGTGPRPEFTWLHAPEIDSVMMQGRAGGAGAPFNIGEVTVIRCSLQLASGEVGHAYIKGRRKVDAEAAAQIDALMLQTAAATTLRAKVLEPLTREATERRQTRAAKAAATKVDFFKMIRGED